VSFPDSPFANLPEESQEHFWEVRGTEYLEEDPELMAEAEWYYAIGFGYTADEYDAMGIDPDIVMAAREDFFDLMGLDEDDFDWAGWREAMGYD